MYRRIAKTAVIIALAVTLVLCTAVSASAKTVVNDVNTLMSVLYSSLHIYKSSGGVWSDVTATQSSGVIDNYLYYSIKSTESWGKGQLYRMLFDCEIQPAYHDEDTNYYGSFQIVGNSNLFSFNLSSSQAYFQNTDGTYTFCNMKLLNDSIVECSFDSGSPKAPFALHFVLDFHNKINTVAYSTNFDLSFMYLNFVSATQSEIITENQNNATNSIINNQNSNKNEIINNQNSNAQQIQANQDRNTDKQIANDIAMQEQEKQEISSSGNDSVDSITSIIPDVGTDGIKNSIESLLDGMSYNGTDCVWTFPALKIPAIGGVIPEIKLTDEQPIDLGYWVRQLPESVLKTIQALCSIAIVLFVLYSLFDFVIYCFSLKSNGSGKGDDDE